MRKWSLRGESRLLCGRGLASRSQIQTTNFYGVCKKTVTAKDGNAAKLFNHVKQNQTQERWNSEELFAVADDLQPKCFFFISSWISLLKITLKYCDIISRLYCPPPPDQHTHGCSDGCKCIWYLNSMGTEWERVNCLSLKLTRTFVSCFSFSVKAAWYLL